MKLLIWSFFSHMPLNNLHMNYSLTFKKSISYFSRVCVHKCCMALSSLCNSIIVNVFIPEMFSSFTQTFLRLIHVLLHSLFVYPFFLLMDTGAICSTGQYFLFTNMLVHVPLYTELAHSQNVPKFRCRDNVKLFFQCVDTN